MLCAVEPSLQVERFTHPVGLEPGTYPEENNEKLHFGEVRRVV